MIWAFEQKTLDWESQYHTGKVDIQFKKIEGSDNFTMVEGPEDTHVFDKDGYFKHQERMSNGFRLFGKYYEGLWS